MFFKLSLKNVRKSISDYTLYFLTLTFGVCVFYVFNSVDSQKVSDVISESTMDIMKNISYIMSIISVFVSFVLGFLIVYANNFLIRRRKKEIGIYMTLGMKKSKVANLLLLETLVIGTISLTLGLICGIFLSQALSIVTARLFEADLTKYQFMFSPGAFAKTIIYFGIIFLVVMFMSTISISKYKLIDIINAERKNEKLKLKNPVVTILLFVLSIGFLSTAYVLFLKNGVMVFNKILLFEVILGTIGTFLFFASLSGFFLKLLQSNKKLYLKGLNMFILRQINCRINTAHISMSLICLMLFLTIGILSSGLGINNALNNSYEYCVPYDISLGTSGDVNIIDKYKELGFNINDYGVDFVDFKTYIKEGLSKKIIFDTVGEEIPVGTRNAYINTPLYMIKLSHYNNLMRLQGKDVINLSQDEVALYSDYAEAIPSIKTALSEFIKKGYPIAISEVIYKTYPYPLTESVMTSLASNIMIGLVVPDKIIEGAKVHQSILSLNCRGNSRKIQLKMESELFNVFEHNSYKNTKINVQGISKVTVKTFAAGTKAIISYVGIYVGIIFLVTSAALLALQQLSEASDNKRRYDILQKIGASKNLINSALLKQIAIYFTLPLSLACVHSIFGIKVANDVVLKAGGADTAKNIIITAVIIVGVYGAYFVLTYLSSKKIVLGSKN